MKTYIVALHNFWKEKIVWFGVINTLVVRASTRIARRNMFPGGLDKILQFRFPVAHGEFLRLQYEEYI